MTDGATALGHWLDRLQRRAMLVAGVGVVLAVAGALTYQAAFFRAYLVAYLFWLGIALGCLALSMVHHLTGGAWGAALRRIFESGARTLPVMGLLWLPLLLGLDHLYHWTHAADDPVLARKAVYLNVPFFVARAVLYFVSWSVLATLLTRWSWQLGATVAPAAALRLRRLSAAGLVLFGLTVTFALVDWVMSIEPHWYSTIYGGMVATGGVLAAMAFAVGTGVVLARRSTLGDVLTPGVLNDLGSLLFAFVMIWTYLAFSQFLLIYAANLREEVPWYTRRFAHGWQWVALMIVAGNFVLPFAALLSRTVKRQARLLGVIACGILLVRLIDIFWLVAPPFRAQLGVHWLDLVTPLALGGVWVALFVRHLKARSLLAPFDLARATAGGGPHG